MTIDRMAKITALRRREFLKMAAATALVGGGARTSYGANVLADLSASAAVEAMRQGDIKSEHYAEALLSRAKEVERLNVFRTLKPDMVLEAAKAADKVRASGNALGVLHGLPIPVKDSINTKMLPTSNGTLSLRDFKPKDNASVLNSLLAQGAIIMGKTNLAELSASWTSNNSTFGAVHNPYDPSRVPGGSSGGSAVAVAARVAPLAVGEDTLGSIRVPASCCGIIGLRPSYGRYPDDGIMPLTISGFDQVGPLARSVADIALFDAAVTGDARPLAAMPLKGVRIGTSSGFLSSGASSEVQRANEETLRKLREAGATIVDVEIPEIVKSSFDISFTIFSYEMEEAVGNFLKEQDTGLTFQQMLAQTSPAVQGLIKTMVLPPNRPPNNAYEAMIANRKQLKEAIGASFAENGISVLAFPTILVPPPKIGEEVEVEVDGKKVPLYPVMGRNISLGSCASMASLVLPASLTTGGLPIGMEFAALTGRDRELLSLGLSLEKALGPLPAPKV